MAEINLSAAILAGGSSLRFGGITKPNLIIGGMTIISRIISTVKDLFDEIIIVTNKSDDFTYIPDCKIVKDIFIGAGPMGGIHAALVASANNILFVFAGDMPFIDKHLINKQIRTFLNEQHDILVPSRGGLMEPLHAIYRKNIIKTFELFITERKNYSIRDLIRESDTGYFEIPESQTIRVAFTNINSPGDMDIISSPDRTD